MAEEKDVKKEAKREITYVAGSKPDDGKSYLTTNIGFGRSRDTKYEVYFLIPSTEEDCQARYGCPLSDLIEAGVRQLSTRVDYPSVGFTEKGTLKPEGHKAMQDLADGYKPGQRAAAKPAVKKKASQLDELFALYGVDNYEDLKAAIAKKRSK